MNLRRTLLLACLLSPVLALPGAMSEATAQEDRPLVILEEDEPQTTYPFLARTMSESRLAELLFDRFFTLSSGGDVQSRIFDAGWSAKPPNLSLTVAEGTKFSDGSAATFSARVESLRM